MMRRGLVVCVETGRLTNRSGLHDIGRVHIETLPPSHGLVRISGTNDKGKPLLGGLVMDRKAFETMCQAWMEGVENGQPKG